MHICWPCSSQHWSLETARAIETVEKSWIRRIHDFFQLILLISARRLEELANRRQRRPEATTLSP